MFSSYWLETSSWALWICEVDPLQPHVGTLDFYAIACEVATLRFLHNAAKTEYISIEYIKDTNLGDVWMELEEPAIAFVTHQIAQLESRMMPIAFPAGVRAPLKDGDFCVGPDARLPMWFGRRSQLDVDKGPYEDSEATIATKLGRPLLPFQRERREFYGYEKQQPSDHMENLERYLVVAPLLVPKNPSLREFRTRHPDLQPSNIILSTASGPSNIKIIGLIDWQHTTILPRFLSASIPNDLQNYNDPVSQGETHALKASLIEVAATWKKLVRDGVPCPIKFEREDVLKTKEPDDKLKIPDENFETCRDITGFEAETWVPNEHYETAKSIAEMIKLNVFERIPEPEVRAKAEANWFLDDMDETDYS
ncbi:hypothetical protein SCHPADRAFT_923405 [Schizopora paradoxa]|uniref:Aminoglycoside phosphotransferase domain-containing protein n=1 Tax=Schizopora paradoxa TaxID=27342 RepID=A0A0H2R0L6_9AGAM|nr:hypothetical protein SCHPADRAFT_923405 [Schizopora paradoxa]